MGFQANVKGGLIALHKLKARGSGGKLALSVASMIRWYRIEGPPSKRLSRPSGEKLEFHTFDILNQLRMRLQEVQYGEHEDRHGWMVEVTC